MTPGTIRQIIAVSLIGLSAVCHALNFFLVTNAGIEAWPFIAVLSLVGFFPALWIFRVYIIAFRRLHAEDQGRRW